MVVVRSAKLCQAARAATTAHGSVAVAAADTTPWLLPCRLCLPFAASRGPTVQLVEGLLTAVLQQRCQAARVEFVACAGPPPPRLLAQANGASTSPAAAAAAATQGGRGGGGVLRVIDLWSDPWGWLQQADG